MNWWLCSECQYILEADVPPKTCPGCHKDCQFNDVTCYIPECGGPGNLDHRLVALKVAGEKTRKAQL
jgi:rubredoxin